MSDPRDRLEARPGAARRRTVFVAGVLAVVLALGATLGFGLTRDPRGVRSVLVGRPAPDFALPTLDGSATVRLSDLRGRAVVINFWASWCAECRVEHPALEAAWARYRDRGVVLLGIPFEDLPDASRAYVGELGGGWPILEDPGSRTGLAYGVFGVPETYFIDPGGTIVERHVGPVGYEDLTAGITRLLERDA